MIRFDHKVLFVGYGSVARCTLPIFVKHIQVPLENITVLDFEDQAEILKPWTEQGVCFVRQRITPENMGAILGKYLAAGDLLIDLAWNIDCCGILQWCHDRGVLYLDTSVEAWDPYDGSDREHPTERTLYHRHMAIREMMSQWKTPGPTAVVEHGANPGLISHFVKQGLIDIDQRVLEDKKVAGQDAEELE